MRRIMLFLMICCLMSMAQAAVLSYESFTGYTVGTQLDEDIPSPAVSGYTGDWTRVDWGDQQAIVQSGSLAYGTALGDSVGAPYIAGSEIAAGNSGRVYRLLDSTLTVTDATEGTLYLSWVFKSGQETGATTYQMLDLYNLTTADANRNFTAGLTQNGGQTGSIYDFGVDEVYYNTGVAADTAEHLFVVRFILSATAASDSVTVWLDPTSETGGTTVSGVDLTFDRLSISDYDGNSAGWDEIRWGTTFVDVLPAIMYSSPANGADFIAFDVTSSENDLIFTINDPNIVEVDVQLGQENDPNLTDDPLNNGYKIVDGMAVTTGEYTVDLVSLSNLEPAADYYWKVIGYEPNAVSGQNDIMVLGPVWSFSTIGTSPEIGDAVPAYTVVDAGEPNILLTVTGDMNIETYQWYKDGIPLPDDLTDTLYIGEGSPSLTIYNVVHSAADPTWDGTDDEGYYYCVGTKAGYDDVVSSSARVMIYRQTSYYDFETFADSIDGYTATPMADDPNNSSGPTLVTDANSIVGAYVYIDNGDDATDPNGQYLQLDAGVSAYDDITISMWAHALSKRVQQRLIDFGSGNTYPNMFLSADYGNGSMRFTLDDGNGANYVQAPYLAPGAWTHVAVTQGTSTAKIFVNGEWIATTATYKNPRNCQSLVNYIGKSIWPDPYFHGYIDEVKIWNYALSAQDIAEEYLTVAGGTYVCDWEGWNADQEMMDFDIDDNCEINLADFAAFAGRWLDDIYQLTLP